MSPCFGPTIRDLRVDRPQLSALVLAERKVNARLRLATARLRAARYSQLRPVFLVEYFDQGRSMVLWPNGRREWLTDAELEERRLGRFA